MEMVLVWHDAQSFRQHIEAMKTFRQLHGGKPEGRSKLLKNMPVMVEIDILNKERGTTGCISPRRRSILMAIWEIALPRGSQN